MGMAIATGDASPWTRTASPHSRLSSTASTGVSVFASGAVAMYTFIAKLVTLRCTTSSPPTAASSLGGGDNGGNIGGRDGGAIGPSPDAASLRSATVAKAVGQLV